MPRIYIAVFFALLINNYCFGQNLVPNPSFESHPICPAGVNGGSNFDCDTWVSANYSADYYNSCDAGGPAGVPANLGGYQKAQDGNGYVGFYAYNVLGGYDYSEYVMAPLPPLKIGATYTVTIHISLAESSPYAVNGFGVYFDTYGQPAHAKFNNNLGVTPQVDYSSAGMISDTANWVTLAKTFIADSAYTYLVIGDFLDNNHIDTLKVPTANTNAWPFSYYYLDNIIVANRSDAGITSPANNENESKLYPNPFSDHAVLVFSNPGNQSHTLLIYNLQGQLIQKTENITDSHITIERENMPNGFYYYQLVNSNNIVANGKFIIN